MVYRGARSGNSGIRVPPFLQMAANVNAIASISGSVRESRSVVPGLIVDGVDVGGTDVEMTLPDLLNEQQAPTHLLHRIDPVDYTRPTFRVPSLPDSVHQLQTALCVANCLSLLTQGLQTTL